MPIHSLSLIAVFLSGPQSSNPLFSHCRCPRPPARDSALLSLSPLSLCRGMRSGRPSFPTRLTVQWKNLRASPPMAARAAAGAREDLDLRDSVLNLEVAVAVSSGQRRVLDSATSFGRGGLVRPPRLQATALQVG
jgi:hypothetical protein